MIGVCHYDFREILKSEFEKRRISNPRFSLRAYAKFLGVSPAGLSQILNKKRKISTSAAITFSKKFGYSKKECEFFIDLVNLESPNLTEQKRNQIIQRLESYSKTANRNIRISIEDFERISDWHYLAIIQTLALKNHYEPKELAIRLGITPEKLTDAYLKLASYGLIRKEANRWVPTYDNNTTADELSSESIRRFHRQIVRKAHKAIDTQTIHQRYLRSSLITIRSEDFEAAKSFLDECNKEFMKRFDRTSNGDSVYALSLQFFDALNIKDK